MVSKHKRMRPTMYRMERSETIGGYSPLRILQRITYFFHHLSPDFQPTRNRNLRPAVFSRPN